MSFSSRENIIWESLLTGVLLIAGFMILANVPELRRYALIRSM